MLIMRQAIIIALNAIMALLILVMEMFQFKVCLVLVIPQANYIL